MLSRLKFLVLFVVVAITAVPCRASGQQTVDVTVTGTAMLLADQAQARDQAIMDALRKAVQQAAGMMLTSSTEVHNFVLVKDEIFAKTRGYVQQYTILNEAREEEIYRISVSARVKTGPLKDDLAAIGVLMEGKALPRLLLCITEVVPGEGPKYWWRGNGEFLVAENAMAGKLQDMHFVIVDRSTTRPPGINVESIFTDRHAVLFGQHYDAEVVLVGKAVVSSGTRVGSYSGLAMRSYNCTMSVRAVRVGNGRVLASATTSAASVHMDTAQGVAEAVTKAATIIARKLGEGIIEQYKGEVSSTTVIKVVVKGLNYSEYIKFRGLMCQHIRLAKKAYHRNFSANTGYMDVAVLGNADSLAAALVTQGVPGFDIEVTDVRANDMEIMVKSGEHPSSYKDEG